MPEKRLERTRKAYELTNPAEKTKIGDSQKKEDNNGTRKPE